MKAESSSHAKRCLSLILISPFSHHQLKTLRSKITSVQIWTWEISDWRPCFFLHDGVAKLKTEDLIQSAISSFTLKQESGHLRSLFQTSISLTLTSQWQKAADCQKWARNANVYHCTGKEAQCLCTQEGCQEEAALHNGKTPQKL